MADPAQYLQVGDWVRCRVTNEQRTALLQQFEQATIHQRDDLVPVAQPLIPDFFYAHASRSIVQWHPPTEFGGTDWGEWRLPDGGNPDGDSDDQCGLPVIKSHRRPSSVKEVQPLIFCNEHSEEPASSTCHAHDDTKTTCSCSYSRTTTELPGTLLATEPPSQQQQPPMTKKGEPKFAFMNHRSNRMSVDPQVLQPTTREEVEPAFLLRLRKRSRYCQ